MAPMGPRHAWVTDTLRRLVDQLDPEVWAVGSQTPVRLDERSEPEPDVWVARDPRAVYRHRYPAAADLVLVVEVAYTSLAYDRQLKLPAYAAAGVHEVWIVSLPEGVVHRHTAPAGRAYRVVSAVTDGTLPVAGIEVDVSGLLS